MKKQLSIKKRAAGFSLLELLVVLMIMGFGASLVVPHLGTQSSEFNGQLRGLLAVLNCARRTAIITGRPSVATIHGGEEKTGDYAENGKRKGLPVGHWVCKGGQLSVEKNGSRLTPREKFKVTFFPEGGATGAKFVLRSGRNSVRIMVDPITGVVSAQAAEVDDGTS